MGVSLLQERNVKKIVENNITSFHYHMIFGLTPWVAVGVDEFKNDRLV
jgi:hypothetical protein